MLHKATLSNRFDVRPVHIECSCGVGGDFSTDAEAVSWMTVVHFRRISGIDTFELPELPSQIPPSEPAPELPEGEGAGPTSETVGDA